MSIDFHKRHPKEPKNKVYNLLDRPPVLECGGSLDKEGVDTYWGRSLTVQADEANGNIHSILSKYEKTGMILPQLIKQDKVYGDFSAVPDYQEALNTVLKAEEQFNALDAKTRANFANSPVKFLEFANDPKNLGEMVKLGLAVQKAEPDATLKDVVKALKPDKATPVDSASSEAK